MRHYSPESIQVPEPAREKEQRAEPAEPVILVERLTQEQIVQLSSLGLVINGQFHEY